MIKRHKVLEEYTVHIYCSKCGRRISQNREFVHKGSLNENNKYVYDWFKYVYTCECGNTEESQNMYPCTQQIFDDEGEIINEN